VAAPDFFDDDGQPVDIGNEVCIQMIVLSVAFDKPTDKFPTITMRLKHPTQGQKFKVSVDDIITAPSCIVAKNV
jgi:hypothetical protein